MLIKMPMKRLNHKRTIIIVTGCPGTGKSYWARRIRDRIKGIDIISYDEIKERNFDLFGFDTREEKDALNARGLEEFYLRLEQVMSEGSPVLIEYPFYQRHRERIMILTGKYDYRAITLFLYGDMKTLYERGVRRDRSGRRHPGHLLNRYHKGVTPLPERPDPEVQLSYEEFCESCGKKNYNIQIGTTISLDVTDLAEVDANSGYILDKIAALP